MNIELARTFLEVVSCGSLAAAADRLHVTHSTVTMRIKTLEDILRCRVLIRNRSGVTMTPDGVRFHHFAESLVRTWQMTQRQMSLQSGFEAMLSIGAESALWEDMMFDWAVKTRRQRPETALRCENGRSEQLVQRLFDGWLDICLVFEAQSRSDFTLEKLFDDPMVIVSTENRDAKGYWDPDYLEIDWNTGFHNQSQAFWPETHETPHLSAANMGMGLRFLMEFGGSTVVPLRVLERGDLAKPLYRVPGMPVFDQSVYLLYSETSLKERLPSMSIDQICDSFKRHLRNETQIWEPARKSRRRAG